MKKRKKSANWYVAATHYLTSGFVVPFLIYLVSGFTIMPFVESLNSFALNIATRAIIGILAIWLGIMYSARYLRKAYIIDNESKEKVVNLSTIYFAVLSAPSFILAGQFFALIPLALVVFLFYKLSYKYITITKVEETKSERPEERGKVE